ncbi:hypothetical protein PIB30_061979 [Stylosanthes scabra]|uniref:Uncharacterized protein n=1 Tax=Stylosanthes scabra TaxID=79078 RepID=A0ABU6TND5_9FABA|nr:hypothetical protein [Stylosanthes scabra]
MENDGASSGSQRSGSAMRADRSASSAQGYVAAKGGNEQDGATPQCYCSVYAILYLSKTSNNPNHCSLGIGGPHCSFFLWLDIHVAKFNRKEAVKCEEVEEDVNEHFSRLKVDNRLGDLEDRIAAIEKKKGINMFIIVMGVAVVAISIWAGRF